MREASISNHSSVTLDHLGIAVTSLDEAIRFYQQILGLQISGREIVAREKTEIAMIPVGDSRIELLQATEPDSPVARFIERHGPGLHHVSLRVRDLDAAVTRLRESGARVIGEEPGTGAGGHRYIFVHPASTGGVLLELVEAPPAER